MKKKINFLKHRTLIGLRSLGIRIISNEKMIALEKSGLESIVQRWSQEKVSKDLVDFIYANHQASSSQLQQDLIALYIASKTSKKTTGFFVEFGATDGITLSNSYLLERRNWKGILAEPDQSWHMSLFQNRTVEIVTHCVYSKSGETVKFRESSVGELSGILEFAENDGWGETRRKGFIREVETISLEDLLIDNNAPNHINFLSIDTEGSEYEIVKDFNFKHWCIDFVVIEHNFTSARESLRIKMEESGYRQIFPIISAWDSWFIREDLVELCDF
jgi:FkbM family methyltransferase